MKNILVIIFALICTSAFSQVTLRKGYRAIQSGDTVTLIYSNGYWVLSSDTTLSVVLDTVTFKDGTKLSTASGGGGGTTDSLYHDDTQTWLANGDTIPKSDSSRLTFTTDTIKNKSANGLILQSSSNATVSSIGSYAQIQSLNGGTSSINLNNGGIISLVDNDASFRSTAGQILFDSDIDTIIFISGSDTTYIIDGKIVSNEGEFQTVLTDSIEGNYLYPNLGTTRTIGAFYKGGTFPSSFSNELNYDGNFNAYGLSGALLNVEGEMQLSSLGITFSGANELSILSEISTSTNPIYLINKNNSTTGIGGTFDYVSLIDNGNEALRADYQNVSVSGKLTTDTLVAEIVRVGDSTQHADGKWSKGTTDAQIAIQSFQFDSLSSDTLRIKAIVWDDGSGILSGNDTTGVAEYDTIVVGSDTMTFVRVIFYAGFADSSETISMTQSTPTQITGNGNELFTSYINEGGFTFQNDSVQMPITGLGKLSYDFGYSGSNTDSYKSYIYVNDIKIDNRGQFVRGMSASANGSSSAHFWYNFTQGDWVKIMMENTQNNNDPTMVTGNLSIEFR